MVLPISPNTITLSQIAAEFGGTAPHNISEYYGKDYGIPKSGTLLLSNFYGKANPLYSFTSITFTNAGATGISGPTLAQCQSTYQGTNSWVTNTSYFNVSGGKQLWTVPRTGTYDFIVVGAKGGGVAGGRGHYGTVSVFLTINDVITILVGQLGQAGAAGQGGGGGASYVVRTSPSTTVIGIAGGGGGQGDSSTPGSNAGTKNASSNDAGAYPSGGVVTLSTINVGASGAGYLGNGAKNTFGGTGSGDAGLSFTNGGTGGLGGNDLGANGGFGGGGGGTANLVERGGGGGGAGGGGGSTTVTGSAGGGGLSYNLSNLTAVNQSHGYVTVTFVS
jgi:hypothetical protein